MTPHSEKALNDAIISRGKIMAIVEQEKRESKEKAFLLLAYVISGFAAVACSVVGSQPGITPLLLAVAFAISDYFVLAPMVKADRELVDERIAHIERMTREYERRMVKELLRWTRETENS